MNCSTKKIKTPYIILLLMLLFLYHPRDAQGAVNIDPPTRTFTKDGGGGSILTSGTGTWAASTNVAWITITPRITGNAGESCIYVVNSNFSADTRQGIVTVDDKAHTVTQTGYSATLTPANASVDLNGGSAPISISTAAGVEWTAVSNAAWVTVTPGSGTSSGSVSYTVAPYSGVTTRTTSLTIAGKTFNVTQTGTDVNIAPSSTAKSHGSDIAQVQVSALVSTTWTVTSNASWISVVDGGNGFGDSTVTLAISTNPSYLERTGTVSIGSATFTIVQDGAANLAFDILPKDATAEAIGAYGNVAVLATPDAPWAAESLTPWVVVSEGGSGAGNGNIQYVVSANPGLTLRTGQILVKGASPPPSRQDFTRGLLHCFNGRSDFARGEVQISGGNYPSFDGTSRAYLPDAVRKATDSWALAFTFTHNSNGGTHRLMEYNTGGRTLAAWVDTNNKLNVRLASTVQTIVDMSVTAGHSHFVFMQGSTTNVQVYVCKTGEKPEQKLFFSSISSLFPPGADLSPFVLGGSSFPTTGNFVGTLNFLSFHDRQLTDSEIQSYQQTTPWMDTSQEPSAFMNVNRSGTVILPARVCLLRANLLDQITGQTSVWGLFTPNNNVFDLVGSLDRFGRVGNSLKTHAASERLATSGTFRTLSFWIKASDVQNKRIWGFSSTSVGSIVSRINYKEAYGTRLDSITTTANEENKFYSLVTGPDGQIKVEETSVTEGTFYPDVYQNKPPANHPIYTNYLYLSQPTAWNPQISTADTSGVMLPSRWHHIALSLSSSGVVTLILDGQSIGNLSSFSSRLSGQQFKNLGNDSYPSWIFKPVGMQNLATHTFGGEIDDVAIYSQELTEQEIRTLYLSQKATELYHTVTQGVVTASISPVSASLPATGGTASTNLTIAYNVNWTAGTTSPWLSITSPVSGAGSTTVQVLAAANPTVYQRQGTVDVAGNTFSITQAGLNASVQHDELVFATDGGSGWIDVATEGSGQWQAVSNVSWITVAIGQSGVGAGSVFIVADPYTQTSQARMGTLTIAGRTVYVTQRGYQLSVSPQVAQIGSNAGAGEFGVAAPLGAVWEAITSQPWITINGGISGVGSGTLRYSVAANTTGTTRTGRIIVSGSEYTITQASSLIVTVQAGTGGSATGGGDYQTNATATLTAIPSTGYAFSHWTGDAVGSANPLSLAVNSDKTVQAAFIPTSAATSIASTAVNNVINDPNPYGLYRTDQVRAMALGQPLLEKNVATGKMKIELGLKQSSNLLNWTDITIQSSEVFMRNGKLQIEVVPAGDAAFYKVYGSEVGNP